MTDRDTEAIAVRVVELLRDDEPFPRSGLVTAARVARLLSVETDWVYDHKLELGAVRLGEGRGALRFEAAAVHAYVRRCRIGRPDARAPRPGRLRAVTGVEMLPLPDAAAAR